MKIQYSFADNQYRGSAESELGENWKKKVFEIALSNLITSVYPQGIKGIQARCYNRILLAVDSSVEKLIDISIGDAEFLKSIVFHEQAAVPAGQAAVFCLLQDEVERAFKENQPEIIEEKNDTTQ